MVSIIVGAVFIIILGLILIIFPTQLFELFESWKHYAASDPSDLYIGLQRVGGAIVVVVGTILLIVGIVLAKSDSSYWDAVYETDDMSENNYWVFNKGGNLDLVTCGTYSFSESDGETFICILPEGETAEEASLYTYVLINKEDGDMQLSCEQVYLELLENDVYSDEDLTAESFIQDYKYVSGDKFNSERPVEATYQLIKDGEETPLHYKFHADGTYQMVQTLQYCIKNNSIIKIEKENYSYWLSEDESKLQIPDLDLEFEKVSYADWLEYLDFDIHFDVQ